MPELPEVETIVRQLNERLAGRKVRRLEILDAKLQSEELLALARSLKNCVSTGASRCGKLAVLHFRSPSQHDLHLSVHLRMTGRLLWYDSPNTNGQRKPRAILHFADGVLHFQDTRRFGVIALSRGAMPLSAGLDPFDRKLSPRVLADLLKNCRTEIKPWLMRQDRLSGLGNIYASEILFDSFIHPQRRAGEIDAAEIKRLLESTRRILKRAIKNCGVTFSDFQDANGRMGSYQSCLSVYARAAQPCRRCGTPIKRLVQQQRSTFYCPHCQH